MDAEDLSRAESEQIRQDAQADAADKEQIGAQAILLAEFVAYLEGRDYKICEESCHRVGGRSEWAWENTPVDPSELAVVISSFLKERQTSDPDECDEDAAAEEINRYR